MEEYKPPSIYNIVQAVACGLTTTYPCPCMGCSLVSGTNSYNNKLAVILKCVISLVQFSRWCSG